jgi:hypothetical protein
MKFFLFRYPPEIDLIEIFNKSIPFQHWKFPFRGIFCQGGRPVLGALIRDARPLPATILAAPQGPLPCNKAGLGAEPAF